MLGKLKWSKDISTLVAKNPRGGIDGAPLVVGVITILKQFHSSNTTKFIGYLAQYVTSAVNSERGSSKSSSGTELPPQAVKALLFLEQFCSFSKMSRKLVDGLLPSYLMDRFTHE
mmetsp:Transcript_15699/g.24851  ORF Transcript_15699/g.24851 Transcript_15699/m.24851 type:complete len:115 (-) Transcript_15699:134-478(-)